MDLLGTDLTKVAGAYSTFAGVLAGFVFGVMGYLLASRSLAVHDHRHDATLSWSLLAFVGLSISCFLFALLSGEDRFTAVTAAHPIPTRIRPLVLTIVASGVFTMAILVLLLALIWLFKREEINDAVLWQLRGIIWLTGLLSVSYFDGTFSAISVALGQGGTVDLHVIQTLVIWALAIVSGEVAGFVLRIPKGDKAHRMRQIVRVVTQIAFVLVVFGCAGLFNIIDDANEAGYSTWHVLAYEWWGVGAFGVVLFLCILNLPGWRAEKDPDRSKEPATVEAKPEREQR